jgi:membrane associated rhomboid family serine protease
VRPGAYRTYSYSMVPPTTRVVTWLLILNGGIFVLQGLFLNKYLSILGLVPSSFLGKGYLWQIATYMFLHGQPGNAFVSLIHILFNMLFLWMMGSELERHWGSREFLKYYFITGCGAGLVNVLVQPASGAITIGASGAIFGLIIAFALEFPNTEILLYFFIRIKAKYFAVLIGALELLALFLFPHAPIARFAHLGGLVIGYLYLKRERLSRHIRTRIGIWRDRVQETAKGRERARRARVKEEMDRILDKISNEGIGSLSDKERRFLQDESGRRN